MTLRLNPLVREVLAGLGQPGKTAFVHLGCLALQGLVLFLWWPPRNDLYHVLATSNPPDPLLALVIALGVTLSYYSVRAGAEEIMLPGQHPLGEWALATPLTLSRILGGYVGGQLLQSLQALCLSSPLLLAAFTVGGGTWPTLLASLGAVLIQALFYRLAGAFVYLVLGQRRTLSLLSVRAVLVLGYALPPVLLPAASHIMVSLRLFHPGAPSKAAPFAEPLAFALVYAGLAASLAVALHLLLSHHRRAAAARRSVPAVGGA